MELSNFHWPFLFTFPLQLYFPTSARNFQLRPKLFNFSPNLPTSAQTFQLQSFQFHIGLSNFSFFPTTRIPDMDTGADKPQTVSSVELSNLSSGYPLSEFSWQICPVSVRCLDSVRILCPVSVCPDSVCLDSVRCPDSVRNFVKNPVRCLSVRILSVSILSGVRILSGFSKKLCPLSVCPAGQGQDRAVRTFAVLVRRRLVFTF